MHEAALPSLFTHRSRLHLLCGLEARCARGEHLKNGRSVAFSILYTQVMRLLARLRNRGANAHGRTWLNRHCAIWRRCETNINPDRQNRKKRVLSSGHRPVRTAKQIQGAHRARPPSRQSARSVFFVSNFWSRHPTTTAKKTTRDTHANALNARACCAHTWRNLLDRTESKHNSTHWWYNWNDS